MTTTGTGIYDTVKGDYLGDQDAIEFMCRKANEAVYELEHLGMPFDRLASGKIYQRPFGGHMREYGKSPVPRACAAADRTGHALLHTLYQANLKAHTHFFVEWMALDLIRGQDGTVLGVTALEMETGETMILQAKATLFASGGAGRIFAASTNAFINTGDGLGMAARAGIPLQDMEFWRSILPGGGCGVLIPRRARRGQATPHPARRTLHARYAPNPGSGDPRLVSRAMATESRQGGPGKDAIILLSSTLGEETINNRLLASAKSPRNSPTGPVKDRSVVPTCHDQMASSPPPTMGSRGPVNEIPEGGARFYGR